MADAPETLWVDPTSRDELNMYVGHDSSTMDYLNMDIKYTRTDITDAPNSNISALCKQLAKVSKERTDAQARIAELESQLASALTLIAVSYSHEMTVEELLLKSKET
jgi:uncharacterized coiled-coil protein SlyX